MHKCKSSKEAIPKKKNPSYIGFHDQVFLILLWLLLYMNQFGHRARVCILIPRRSTNFVRKNTFSPLVNENIVFYSCNNIIHISNNCRMRSIRPNVKLNKRNNSQPHNLTKETKRKNNETIS
jgi:hypothetical protein